MPDRADLGRLTELYSGKEGVGYVLNLHGLILFQPVKFWESFLRDFRETDFFPLNMKT